MSNNQQTPWPELPTAVWRDTAATLQLWTQIVGKIRLTQIAVAEPFLACRRCTSPRAGLTTSPMPDGARTFQIDFDFIDHALRIATSDGPSAVRAGPTFGREFLCRHVGGIAELGIDVRSTRCRTNCRSRCGFRRTPRTPPTIGDAVRRFLQILVNCDRVFKHFRTGFLGKASPVHFFWGSFDLAVTRFSGRRAPRHPGGVPHLPDDGRVRSLFA